MLDLPTVDLIVTEGRVTSRVLPALYRTCRYIRFRRVLLFSPEFSSDAKRYVTEYHARTWDYEAWNRFMIKELVEFVPDGHALNIHTDGFVLNWHGWSADFLAYDYIGAPWWYKDGINVGNGGFSLRSKKYLVETSKFNWPRYAPEDHLAIRENGSELVKRGIKFAPDSVASRFAVEGRHTQKFWDGQFGFHNYHITDISRSNKSDYL